MQRREQNKITKHQRGLRTRDREFQDPTPVRLYMHELWAIRGTTPTAIIIKRHRPIVTCDGGHLFDTLISTLSFLQGVRVISYRDGAARQLHNLLLIYRHLRSGGGLDPVTSRLCMFLGGSDVATRSRLLDGP